MLVAAHAAAELVQVGQAVAVGLVDEDRVGVGNVQPALDDRRGQQHVELVVDEIEHHLFQLAARASGRGRCAMLASGTICCSRSATFSMSCDAVVDEEHLPAAVQFAQHRVADQLGVEAGDARFDGQAVFRRRFQVRDVAQAQQRHVQRARDGRGRHRQHVDGLPERLEPLLHLHAEPLLLVDDHQAQVVELHVLLGQPVRADDDVDGAGRQAAR